MKNTPPAWFAWQALAQFWPVSLRSGCAVAWLLLAAINCRAEYLLRSWTTADGLPDNSVRAIVETSDGYLWLGTANGLARFDGIRFTSFSTADTPGLTTADIFGLAKDAQDGLWMSSRRGVQHYHEGRFSSMPRPEDKLPGGIAPFNDLQGGFWVRHGDDVLRWNVDRFEPHLTKPAGPNSVVAIQASTNGSFWYIARNGLWHVRNGQAQLAAPRFATDRVAQGRDGRLWGILGERSLGFLENGQWRKVTDLPARCRVIRVAANNDVWVGSDTSGYAYRWREGALLEIGPGEGLQGNSTIAIAEDREGNIWLGMNGAGLVRLREKRLRIFDNRHGFGTMGLSSVTEDAHGDIFATCMGHGAYRLVGDRFEMLIPGMESSALRLTTALVPAAAGGTWVGMFFDALPRVDNQRVQEQIGSPAGTRCLMVDRAGDLWRGTRTGGVEHFSGTNVTRYAVSNGLSFNNVYALVEDRDGAVWAGTEEGLNRIHAGRITQFGRTHGLGHHFVTALCVDSRGTLWAGTLGGGLSARHGGRFITVTTGEGLPDNTVQQLIEDDLGHLWIGTRAGLLRVSLSMLHDFLDGKTRAIHGTLVGRNEGIERPTCWTEYQPGGIKARDGRLWICTGSGLVLVDPRHFNQPAQPPIVHIEETEVDGRAPVPLRAGAAPVLLPPRAQRLQVRYTGISTSEPDLIRFRYRLAGYDRDWIEAGQTRLASYSHLNPGSYRFEVVALNNHGKWSEPAVMQVIAQPSWWQLTWFRVALAVAAIGLLFKLHRFRMARVERQRAEREAFSRRLIESQEQDRQRVASELHDGLGQNLIVIKNRAALALARMDPGRPEVAQVAEVSQMASAALQEVRAIAQNLRPYQIDQFGLTQAIESMSRQTAESSGIEIKCDLDNVDAILPAGLEIGFYRIAQESVNNIVKHSQARHATLRIRREDRRVRLTITDDGCGFVADSSSELAGFGLRNMVERARAMRGELSIHSSPGQGTRLELVVPTNSP